MFYTQVLGAQNLGMFLSGLNSLNRFKMVRAILNIKEQIYVLNGLLFLKTTHIKRKLIKILYTVDIFSLCIHLYPIAKKW